MTEVKFADLVRETTTTSGTDNLILKGPPAGYRAFADALEPGDEFYYSIVNQSRPDETETGVGRLEGDGTIARTPTSGAATDFSNGAKQVALVVGAPWFEEVAKGGGGNGGGTPDIPSLGFVNVTEFGAMIDENSSVGSDANRQAFADAASAAVAQGKDLKVPAGTYWIDAASGTASGVRISIPDGERLRIVGEPGAVIKRRAAPTMSATSSLMFLIGNAGSTYEFHNITFDGNEANCEFDAENLFAEEQSANVKWLLGTGTPKAIRFFHCDVGRNRVGDGYHQNIRVEHFMASDCATVDAAVRRPRADWQFSYYSTFGTIMTNCECNSWESEPYATPATMTLMLSNMVIHSTLDLAGDSNGTEINPVRAQFDNVTVRSDTARSGLPFVNFYRVHGSFSNCRLAGIRRIQRCKLTIANSDIIVHDAGGGAAKALEIWHDQISESYAPYTERFGNAVTFDHVRFKAGPGVVTGGYVDGPNAVTLAGQLGPKMVRVSFHHCEVVDPLDYVASFGSAGDVEAVGGALKANAFLFRANTGGSYFTRMLLNACALWDAPLLLDFASPPNVAGAHFILSGELLADRLGGGVMQLVPYHTADPANITWHVTMTLLVSSDPNGTYKTVPGLRAKIARPERGRPVSYIASHASFNTHRNFGGTVWDVLDQPLLSGSKAVSGLAVAAGERKTATTVTVTGARVGDMVAGVSLAAGLQGVEARGEVTANDSVTITVHNPSGSAVTLAASVWHVRLRKAV